jgi:hypothetical protein
MAEFILNQDVETDIPTVEVTFTDNNPLRNGRHRFRLVVVDDSGNRSAPDEVVVIVADQERPTAVLDAPTTVAFGSSIELSGRRSFDAGGGQITEWIWTYLGPSDG